MNDGIDTQVAMEVAPESVIVAALQPGPVIAPTPEEVAKAAIAESKQLVSAKITARIKELEGMVGKFFKKKSGGDAIYEVKRYAGIHQRQKVVGNVPQVDNLHSIVVEGGGARWCPPAIEFLNEYEQVEAPKKSSESEVV